MKKNLHVLAFLLCFYSCKKSSITESVTKTTELTAIQENNLKSLQKAIPANNNLRILGVQGITDPNLGLELTNDELGNVYFSSFPYIGKIDVNTGTITKSTPCFPTHDIFAVFSGRLTGSQQISSNTAQIKSAPITGTCSVTSYPITSLNAQWSAIESDFTGNTYLLNDGTYKLIDKLNSNQTVTHNPFGNSQFWDISCDNTGSAYTVSYPGGQVYKWASKPVYWQGAVGTLAGATSIEVSYWGEVYARVSGGIKHYVQPGLTLPPGSGTWENVPLPGVSSTTAILNICVVNGTIYLNMYPGYILKKTPSMSSFVQIYPQ